MLSMALIGDVMLGRGVNEMLHHMPPEEIWGDTLPLLHKVDVRLANLECAISESEELWQRTHKTFHFRADPLAIKVLQAAKVDVCALANNHTLDFEAQGLLDTFLHLDTAGIHHVGAGRNHEEAGKPLLIEAGEPKTKIAIIAFTDNEPAFAASEMQPGTNYLPVALNAETLTRVDAAIMSAREQGAEVIVFSNHWGPNMVERPTVEFREFARAVLLLGADIYYGHSAHVFQGIEIFQGKPIIYGAGDFIDDYAIDPFMRNDWSFLYHVEMDKKKLKRIELHPVKLTMARVELAHGEQWEAIVKRMEHLSGEMGTKLVRSGRHLVYEAR